jgi:putative component of membrane protein insertase Oxa1/YidC/SpoIIIJ protein YidD
MALTPTGVEAGRFPFVPQTSPARWDRTSMLTINDQSTDEPIDGALCRIHRLWRSCGVEWGMEMIRPFRLNVADRFALAMIAFYQRRLSPHKGFRCAFHARRGGRSCSEYGKRIILESGLVAGVTLIVQRLEECSAAARELRFSAPQTAESNGEKGHAADNSCPCGGCLSFGEIASCSWI